MLLTGQFPNDLKKSRVRPFFKSGDMSLFSNYRPISLLSSFSKIFEYVIFYQIFVYLNGYNLLCIEQFTFRAYHSTELTKQMDTGKTPLNIYIDLSKAFDTLES